MKKSLLIIAVVIVFILFIIGFFIFLKLNKPGYGLGKSAQPDAGDICYGRSLQIISCLFDSVEKKVTVNLKVKGKAVDGFQGIISGKMENNIAGANKEIKFQVNAGTTQSINFQFDKTVDDREITDIENPVIQVRPIVNDKICVQFYSKNCVSKQ